MKITSATIAKLTTNPDEIAVKRVFPDFPGVFFRLLRADADAICGKLNEIFRPHFVPTAEGDAWRAIHDDGLLGIECAATIPDEDAIAFLFRHLAQLAAA